MAEKSSISRPALVRGISRDDQSARRYNQRNVSNSTTMSYNSDTKTNQSISTTLLDDVIFATHNISTQLFNAKVTYLNLGGLDISSQYHAQLLNVLKDTKLGDIMSIQIVHSPNQDGALTIKSIIAGKDDDGYTLIKTAFGVLSTNVEIGVKAGAEILLQLHPQDTSALGVAQTKNTSMLIARFFALLQGHANVLNDTLTIVSAFDEHGAKYRAIASSMVAKKNKKIVDNVLKKSRVVASDKVEQWIDQEIVGPVVDSKEHHPLKALDDLVEKLKRVSYPINDELWRTILIPIFDGIDRRICKIFVRGSSTPGHFIRFVIDFDVENRMMQFDGLVHFSDRGSDITHVDHIALVLRSKTHISKDLMRNVSKIFIAHQNITGIDGVLNFEENVTFPIDPESEAIDQESVKDMTILEEMV